MTATKISSLAAQFIARDADTDKDSEARNALLSELTGETPASDADCDALLNVAVEVCEHAGQESVVQTILLAVIDYRTAQRGRPHPIEAALIPTNVRARLQAERATFPQPSV